MIWTEYCIGLQEVLSDSVTEDYREFPIESDSLLFFSYSFGHESFNAFHTKIVDKKIYKTNSVVYLLKT